MCSVIAQSKCCIPDLVCFHVLLYRPTCISRVVSHTVYTDMHDTRLKLNQDTGDVHSSNLHGPTCKKQMFTQKKQKKKNIQPQLFNREVIRALCLSQSPGYSLLSVMKVLVASKAPRGCYDLDKLTDQITNRLLTAVLRVKPRFS